MQKFTEFVSDYRNWKKSTHGTARIAEGEMAIIRKRYEEAAKAKRAQRARARAKLNENKKAGFARPANREFTAFVNQYREWKKVNKGSSRLSERELASLRTSFKENKAKANVANDENKVIAQYREWKKANKGSSVVSLKERQAIRETLKSEAKKPSVRAKLFEAKKLVRRARMALNEADMLGAADATQQAGMAINDAAAMAGAPDGTAPTSPLPQNVLDSITVIKQSVDQLATEVGIESPVDLGADPAAGVPATDGIPPTDPMAMPENVRAVRARLAAREARMKENFFSDVKGALPLGGYADKVQKTIPCDKQAKIENAGQVVIPGTSELLNGTKKGAYAAAKTWPTKPVANPGDKKLGNVKEAEDNDSWAEKRVMEAIEAPSFSWKEWVASNANQSKRY